MQFSSHTIGSLSQHDGVRLQLSMTNEALEIVMGLFGAG